MKHIIQIISKSIYIYIRWKIWRSEIFWNSKDSSLIFIWRFPEYCYLISENFWSPNFLSNVSSNMLAKKIHIDDVKTEWKQKR